MGSVGITGFSAAQESGCTRVDARREFTRTRSGLGAVRVFDNGQFMVGAMNGRHRDPQIASVVAVDQMRGAESAPTRRR